jgi:hypothetical protein
MLLTSHYSNTDNILSHSESILSRACVITRKFITYLACWIEREAQTKTMNLCLLAVTDLPGTNRLWGRNLLMGHREPTDLSVIRSRAVPYTLDTPSI